MKKIVLSTVVASSLMFGANVEPFVGIDFIKGKVNTKETLSGTITEISSGDTLTGSITANNKLKDNTYGIKAGGVIDQNHRVYVSYVKLSDKVYGEKLNYILPAINYDYLILNDKLKGFIPYVGVHMGYGKTKYSDGLKNVSSIDGGFNLGVIKEITNNVSLELGYKYTYVNTTSGISGTITSDDYIATGTCTQKNKDAQAISFGINYKF